jgi:hypothetical protein
MTLMLISLAVAGCEPKKPSEPRPPTPKVDLMAPKVDVMTDRSTS